MTRFQVHTHETAPAAARPSLDAAKKAFGMVPNLIGALAEAPAAAEAYLAIGGAFGKSSLSATEQQTVLLTVSFLNECHYCMAAHSTVAKAQDVPADVIAALRDGSDLADERLGALQRFMRAVVDQRGWVQGDALEAFLDAGFSKQHALEVVTGVAMKTLSNYANHLLDTPVDDAFAAMRWQKPQPSV